MNTAEKIENYLNEGNFVKVPKGYNDKLQRSIRTIVGPGKTESERGMCTIFYARGKEAFEKALEGLNKKYKKTKETDFKIDFKTENKKVITLKKFEKDTNNYVSFDYTDEE